MCEITKNLTYLVIGAFLGALATGVVEWKLSQDENEMELRNVAQALYYDVAYIEDFLNYSLNHSSSKPGYVHVIDAHYYDDNGLFFDFKKDISKMDEFDHQNTCLYKLNFDGKKFHLELENNTKHLQ